VLEELEGQGGVFPIPNSFNQSYEKQEFSYLFAGTAKDPSTPIPRGRWTEGPSLDGKGQFTARQLEPQGEEPQLAPPPPEAFAQVQQMGEEHKGLFDKVKEKIT
jgi:Mn-containing catalase